MPTYRRLSQAFALTALALAPLTAAAAPSVAADAAACRNGLTPLETNLYAYPDRPEAASRGKQPWKTVYEQFKASALPACTRVGDYLTKNKGEAVAANAATVTSAAGVASYGELFTGRVGLTAMGDRILQYCPNLHQSQFDCVSASTRISAAAASLRKILDPLAALECDVEKGWSGCRSVDVGGAQVKIFATPAVSLPAQGAVETIYSDILGGLKAPYEARDFNGYKVYLTNGEAWADLKGRPPMGFMGTDAENDEIRGGTTAGYLWIEEQMICKTGVATRNQAYAEGRRATRDDDVRTFDQVVHEFAHALDFRYGLKAKYDPSAFQTVNGFPSEEAWAWGVQHYLGTPAGTDSAAAQAFVASVIDRSKLKSYPYDCAKLLKAP